VNEVSVLRIEFEGLEQLQAEVELSSADCWEAGAEGIEERADERSSALLIYAKNANLDAIRAVLAPAVSRGARLIGVEEIREEDWSETWKRGLGAIEVSGRLIVRPSFAPAELKPGQMELVIDPRQAFGTGGHASTHLVLQWVDAFAAELDAKTRVLDVGTGTGVLALAALRFGAGRAVGFDLDPVATPEALHWAQVNGLESRFHVFTGTIASLQARPFDWVFANLLRRELLPEAAGIAAHVAERGRLVIAGLLRQELDEVVAAFQVHGLELLEVRSEYDAGNQEWISPLLRRT